jgi:aspartyl/asparaginyl-tRNA synthetase
MHPLQLRSRLRVMKQNNVLKKLIKNNYKMSFIKNNRNHQQPHKYFVGNETGKPVVFVYGYLKSRNVGISVS